MFLSLLLCHHYSLFDASFCQNTPSEFNALTADNLQSGDESRGMNKS